MPQWWPPIPYQPPPGRSSEASMTPSFRRAVRNRLHALSSGEAVQAIFDFTVNLALCKFGRNTDRIFDRVCVRPAMADDTDTLYAEKGSSAELGVIDAFLKLFESRSGENV